MAQILSAILSPAIGVLISPFPIVGLILILLSGRSRSNSIFYTAGWLFGNAVVFTLAMLFMGAGLQAADGPGPIAKVVSAVLGLLLVVLAVREFLKRPRKGEKPKVPGWFEKMSKIGPVGAAGFGAFLSALNPKNLLLSLSAGAAAGALGLSGSDQVLSAVLYTLIASASIIVPTVAFLIAGHRMDHALDEMREWLIDNNAVIMSVLLLVIGINVIIKAF